MKRVLLSVLAIATFATATAQKKGGTKIKEKEVEKVTSSRASNSNIPSIESSKGEEFLPEEGDWAIGFNANNIFKNLARSFNGNTPTTDPEAINLTQGAFVGKYFIADNQAYRVIVNLGYGSTTTTKAPTSGINPAPVIETETKNNKSEFDIKIGLGKEWRRGKTRLQGFYGADALIGYNTGLDEDNTVTTTTTLSNGSSTSTFSGTKTNKSSIFSIGLEGFIGAEYFILPKMALGLQYNWGIALAFSGKSTVTTSGTGIPDVEVEQPGRATAFLLGSNNLGSPVGVGTTSLNLTLHF